MMGACVTNKNNHIHCIPQPKLPDDCLKLIFDKLNEKEDRDSFGLTCRNFLDIQNSCRNKHLDFKSSYSKTDCKNHHDSPIRCRSKKNHDSPIQLFNRFHLPPLTSCDELLRLFHRFNHIESLSLTNGDRLFDSSIKKLQIYLCRLHSLDLSDCSYLTDKGLTTAASSCPLLSVIRLRDCNSITDKGLNFLTKFCKSLKLVDLSGCSNITDKGLTMAASSCPLLSVIHLRDCNSITDNGLKFLTKFCKSLKLVDLSGCSNITDTGIGYINQNCRQLRALRISGCRNIRGLGFLGFSRSLVSLEAERCMLDSGGVAAILCGVGIEYLNISCERFYYVAPIGIGLGGSGANIRILKIGGRYIDVDSDTIMNIAKGCPLLQEWNLSSCEEIDISGWKTIGLYCQNLKTIHVNFQERFNMFNNNEIMDAKLIALSHCRRLAVIYMHVWWPGRKRSPHEIRDVMRKDVKIIEYTEVSSKNTISWDNWGLQYDSKMRE